VNGLAISAFGIGTTEFVIMGLLPEVAADFGVSIPSAGLLISGYALGVVVGAPLLTALASRVPRKTVLVALMGLFIAGEGQVGGHAVATGSVHYADGYSGYGPITTGPQGCSYLTLRPSFDNTRHLLPAEAALAKGRKGRQHNARMNLDAACVPGVIALFERPDGVGAYQVEVAPGAAPASVMLRGGSYWVVMRGEAEIDGQASPPSTCVWVGEGEAPPAIIAGPDGVTIAVLGFADRRSQTARGARTWQGAEVH